MSESQNIEWKASWRDEYLKGICAFANASGGVFVIGKSDAGEIIGVSKSKKLMEDLPNKITNLLSIVCEVNLLRENDLEYIEIIVEKSKSAISYDGRYYKRTGSTTRTLTGQSLTDFILDKNHLKWDKQIEPTATLDSIDLDAVEAFKRGAKKFGRINFSEDDNAESILKKLKLIDDKGNLTRASVLLFGKDPTDFSIAAFLKIGKFGETNSELLAQDIVETNAFQLADKALDILNAKYVLRSISYDRLQRVETPEYPYEAIREILFNAIIHRKYRTSPITIRIYSDRLEIWNIGGLPDEITLEELKENHSSHPVNPLMAKTFYLGGHIEAWGRGTIKVIEECKKHGLPEPVFKNDRSGFTAILYKNRTNPEFLNKLSLNDRQLKAIEYVRNNGFITSSIYQKEIKTSDRSASRDLAFLVESKVFKKIGDNKGARYELL